jgi:hypothetical protein
MLVLNMPSHFLSQAAAMKKEDTRKMAVESTQPLKKNEHRTAAVPKIYGKHRRDSFKAHEVKTSPTHA